MKCNLFFPELRVAQESFIKCRQLKSAGIDLENVGSIRVIEDIAVETGAFADKTCTRISD
jgi:hypothetical protein